MAISDSSGILQACRISLGSVVGVHDILHCLCPLIAEIQRFEILSFI
jgi:hypothetical protein